MNTQKIHFIAIGGSAMHNLAIALHSKGFCITGSDDEISEPSKSRLAKHGLLPEKVGWFEDKITSNLTAVVLGMHARIDNPELIKARQLGIKIYSYPEFLYEQSKDKIRIVVGGSHGKTTTTSIIMHVLQKMHIEFDYMVGAQLDGFDTMVRLSETARYMILEGDEYLTSPIDPRPKFHLYKPHIAVITGIAWDHINVFPEYSEYVRQFEIFISLIENGGTLIYCQDDQDLVRIVNEANNQIEKFSYSTHDSVFREGNLFLMDNSNEYPVTIFGEHNLKNISAARLVCKNIGINSSDFLNSLSNFRGAARRLELFASNDSTSIYWDFAHSPSKLKATIDAVCSRYPNRKLVACMELHTFSSLNKSFLAQYANTMDEADFPMVYFNPHTIEHKKLDNITPDMVLRGFANENIAVFTDSDSLIIRLKEIDWSNKNLLLMSSGNFNGVDVRALAKELIAV